MPHQPPQGIACCDRITLFEVRGTCDTSSNNLIIVEEYSVMDFTSRQLRAFLLVAQHRNFTRAAEALFITPSGLSVLIREFENELGFRLFNRTTRHVALTGSGSAMVKVAQESLQKLNAVA